MVGVIFSRRASYKAYSSVCLTHVHLTTHTVYGCDIQVPITQYMYAQLYLYAGE